MTALAVVLVLVGGVVLWKGMRGRRRLADMIVRALYGYARWATALAKAADLFVVSFRTELARSPIAPDCEWM